MESIREFRVESNAYSAEFGRNFGGQINVLTKSGTNTLRGSAYEFHRNDALDARQLLRRRRQARLHAQPVRRRGRRTAACSDRLFYFVGYEALRENLGKTITSFVPDDNARLGILPDGPVTISDAVRPYLDAIPRANGPSIGGGLATHTFSFDQTLDQNFFQGRLDYQAGAGAPVLRAATPTTTREQRLPTDYPQFPRSFISTNQFVTAEYRNVLSDADAADGALRLQPHAHRPERRGEPRRRRCRRSSPAASWSATSTSAACSASVRRARPTCAWRRTSTAASTT